MGDAVAALSLLEDLDYSTSVLVLEPSSEIFQAFAQSNMILACARAWGSACPESSPGSRILICIRMHIPGDGSERGPAGLRGGSAAILHVFESVFSP